LLPVVGYGGVEWGTKRVPGRLLPKPRQEIMRLMLFSSQPRILLTTTFGLDV
jgi:hypothetical protein